MESANRTDNQTSQAIEYGCYEYMEGTAVGNMTWIETLDWVKFWVESIPITAVGSFGSLGNIVVIIVLLRLVKQNQNPNFHRLLISLSIVDIIFLIVYMTDAIVQCKYDTAPEPQWYQVRFKKSRNE